MTSCAPPPRSRASSSSRQHPLLRRFLSSAFRRKAHLLGAAARRARLPLRWRWRALLCRQRRGSLARRDMSGSNTRPFPDPGIICIKKFRQILIRHNLLRAYAPIPMILAVIFSFNSASSIKDSFNFKWFDIQINLECSGESGVCQG